MNVGSDIYIFANAQVQEKSCLTLQLLVALNQIYLPETLLLG